MKKLTAGIFSVLMGLVSVNAAEAAVASKGYVDTKVGANASTIATLTQTVADNKTAAETAVSSEKSAREAADSALDTRVATNTTDITNLKSGKADKATTLAGYGIDNAYTKTEADALLGTKQNAFELGANLVWGTDGKLTTSGIATNDSFDALQKDVTMLKSDAATAGSVANSIAEALKDYSTTAQVDAKDTATLNAAKAYTDELAEGAVATNTSDIAALQTNVSNVYTKTEADTAIADAKKAGTDAAAALNAYKETNDAAVSANTDAISAINDAETGILKQSKDYTDTEIDKLEQSLGTTSGNLSALSEKVTANENAIKDINDSDVMKSGVTAQTVTQVGTNASAITTINNSAAMKSGITSEKVEAYDAYEDQISGAQGAADAAQDTADAAVQAAAAAQATADKAIPAPTPECSNKGNKCVLTSGENGYAWEVIERATGEVVE